MGSNGQRELFSLGYGRAWEDNASHQQREVGGPNVD